MSLDELMAEWAAARQALKIQEGIVRADRDELDRLAKAVLDAETAFVQGAHDALGVRDAPTHAVLAQIGRSDG